MLTQRDIRHRAVMIAIKTGEMPNIDLIWAKQKAEGCVPCFGQGENCPHLVCIWCRQCRRLSGFNEMKAVKISETIISDTAA